VSSSFDSALVDTAAIEDPRLVVLPRGVRLLAVEALVWSKLHRTDGFLPRAAVLRMTDEPAPWQAADKLAEAGVWEGTDDGWSIVGFTDSQMSAERVRAKQEDARKRYDTWQESHRGKRVGNGVTNDSARPAPPAFKGKGQVGGGVAAGLEAAAAAFEGETTDSAETIACHDFTGHQSYHRLSGKEWGCSLCQRRDLAQIVRDAPSEPMRHRYRKIFDKAYGELYGRVSA
jgi:hypothetical protein